MTDTGRVKASPAARRIAHERGVDLKNVGAGSGPGGRILSTDVAAQTATPAGASDRARGDSRVRCATCECGRSDPQEDEQDAVDHRHNLLASKQTIPHFYIKLKIDAGPLFSFTRVKRRRPAEPQRRGRRSLRERRDGIRGLPRTHRRRRDRHLPNANIGIAVGMDDGLVVPVVMNAEQRSLATDRVKKPSAIATNARGGKIESMGSGVFTITNLGMFGTEEFIGIINPPEAAILAVGRDQGRNHRQRRHDEAWALMTMTLSADHRIIDGMLAAKFMAGSKRCSSIRSN